MEPVIPQWRRDAFDHPDWTFELKYDGFRGLADTVNGRMLSKNGNHLKRYDAFLAGLPSGCVFDGEIRLPGLAKATALFGQWGAAPNYGPDSFSYQGHRPHRRPLAESIPFTRERS
jgi:hypothetical protein